MTVKDIVEECHITRQTFYYHFEGIPEMLRWMLENDLEILMEQCLAQKDEESALLGILHGWTSEDTKNIDEIVHNICMIQQGKIRPFE
ncbi:MAG TPA: TetR family transcriptional regulator [Candidatus Fusicatenibacter merdavium]|uniref:TetR family transcriptional regulator n=1 Tax=Candidatus Fusicatenibacter merdavium TaxID=2838600 RepID=A0A9D1XBN3_9FIRM|nr:TetR family transcriptional regulator [Candidatus Fusicatenibacter merdavium]